MAAHYEKAMGMTGYWDRWVGWDMHPFGAWLAGAVWPEQVDDPQLAIGQIARYRTTNGEMLHSFMWQSMVLLRKHRPNMDPAEWAYKACGPVWRYDGPPGGEDVNRGVCGHSSGPPC